MNRVSGRIHDGEMPIAERFNKNGLAAHTLPLPYPKPTSIVRGQRIGSLCHCERTSERSNRLGNSRPHCVQNIHR